RGSAAPARPPPPLPPGRPPQPCRPERRPRLTPGYGALHRRGESTLVRVIDSSLIVAPSILAADFARLADEARAVEGTADWLHVDVMDYHFVPNLTFGLRVVESLRKTCALPFDCHLMIDDPGRWAVDYAEAGAYNVTFHAEAVEDPVQLARDLRAAGSRAGLALDRDTLVEPYLDLLPHFDMLLVMTIKAGFGGQSFIPEL